MNDMPQGLATAPRAADTRPPLVTIIVVNYNYAAFIDQCIRSVAAQDYQNIQCLVLDCASTDGSASVIETALERQSDPRFRFIKRDVNHGHLANALSVIDQIEGIFVNFLDSDDFLFPEFVSTHVRAHLNDLNSAAVSVSDQIQVDSTGQVLAGTCHWHQKWRAQDPANAWCDISNARSWLPRSPQCPDRAAAVTLSFVPAWWSSWPKDRWIWGTTSAMMFRNSIIQALAPGEAELSGYGPLNVDGYFARFGHSVGGTLVIDSTQGAYRRHGRNVWATNPVFGGQTANSVQDEPVRTSVLQGLACKVLMARYEDLIRLLGSELYYSIAWQLMSNDEFLGFATGHPSDRATWENTISSANEELPLAFAGVTRLRGLRKRLRNAAQRIWQ